MLSERSTGGRRVVLVGAMVLAGGRSRRMGEDKAFLRVNGRSLLESAVAALQAQTADVVIVADRADRYTAPGCRGVADLFPGMGPLGGIVSGLAALGPGVHLAVACDMPALQPALLRLLLELAGPEWDAVAPEIDGRLEPLCAVYASSGLPALQRYLESGGRALHVGLACLQLRRVSEAEVRGVDPELRSFTNLNTPADIERLQRSQEHHP